ncbi:hypothetical protein HNQ79_003021 [Streptomyces candidus]|uniref:Uncharacterized protein n=1 Tax=Streptomyces candidus TaxID=67283 RepID=A0A7X0LQ16_9ACTN|nr:hypothetical protein [Streptomyces candidus]
MPETGAGRPYTQLAVGQPAALRIVLTAPAVYGSPRPGPTGVDQAADCRCGIHAPSDRARRCGEARRGRRSLGRAAKGCECVRGAEAAK